MTKSYNIMPKTFTLVIIMNWTDGQEFGLTNTSLLYIARIIYTNTFFFL